MDCSLPGSSLHGILQARELEWVAISFSRGSSQPRDQTRVSCIPGRRFNLWATREAPNNKQESHYTLWIEQGNTDRTNLQDQKVSASFNSFLVFTLPCTYLIIFSHSFLNVFPKTLVAKFSGIYPSQKLRILKLFDMKFLPCKRMSIWNSNRKMIFLKYMICEL